MPCSPSAQSGRITRSRTRVSSPPFGVGDHAIPHRPSELPNHRDESRIDERTEVLHQLGGFVEVGQTWALRGAVRCRRWAKLISDWDAEGKDVWLYFNNDPHGYAVRNALFLRGLLS